MITYLLAGWLLFTLGIALERAWARRTALFIVLWLLMSTALVAGYGLAVFMGIL